MSAFLNVLYAGWLNCLEWFTFSLASVSRWLQGFDSEPEKCFKPEQMLITPCCDPGELEGSLLGLLLAEPDFGYILFCTCPHEICWSHILLPAVCQSHKFHEVISSRSCARLLGDYLPHNFSHTTAWEEGVRCVNGVP